MKYQGAKLRQMLAAEYVLGTLQGRARRRFERLLLDDAPLRNEVHYWERRLAGLGASIKPVTPREVVWAAIDVRISASTVKPLRPASGFNAWRAWAVVSTAASVLLGFGLWEQVQQGPQIIEVPKIVTVQAPAAPLPYVALLRPDKSEARWKVSLYPDRGLMKVSASGHYNLNLRQCLELWVIEAGGPRSLGVLPMSGDAEMPLPAGMQKAEGEMTLAISLEPQGGSPTGQPTGPVILAAPAVRVL